MAYILSSEPKEKLTYLNSLFELYPSKVDKNIPNELLYGRAGYLYPLLFVRRHIEQCDGEHGKKIDDVVKQVRNFIIIFSLSWILLT